MKITITFTEALLGTVPKNPDVYAKYIAVNSPDPGGEVATVPVSEEAGWTGFHTEGGKLFLYDYAIKGFFKDACSMLARCPDSASSKLRAYKKTIDGLIFPLPRKLFIDLSGQLLTIERPLRAQTAQGERIALARSDAVPAGSTMRVDLRVLGDLDKLLREWLDYGAMRGLGQWRNSGYGRFEWIER